MNALSSDWKFFDTESPDNKLFISPRSDGKAIVLSPTNLETKVKGDTYSFDFSIETIDSILSLLESFLDVWRLDSYVTTRLNPLRLPVKYGSFDKSIRFTDNGFSFVCKSKNKMDSWTYLTPANCQKFVYLLNEVRANMSLQKKALAV